MRGKSMIRLQDPLKSGNVFDIRVLPTSTASCVLVAIYITKAPGLDDWLWVADLTIRNNDLHIMSKNEDHGVIVHPLMVNWLAHITMSYSILGVVKRELAHEADAAKDKAESGAIIISLDKIRHDKRKRRGT